MGWPDVARRSLGQAYKSASAPFAQPVEETPMPAPDERLVSTPRSSRRLTRRQWLLQVSILSAGGLLAAAAAPPGAAATLASGASPSTVVTSAPRAPTVGRAAPLLATS